MRIPKPVAGLLLTLSCGGYAWEADGAPKTPPDEQFRTGVEAGADVYVWHCVDNTRVVVTQNSSACFGASRPRVAHGPCGAPLSAEQQYPDADGGRRGDIPDGYKWPGSKK